MNAVTAETMTASEGPGHNGEPRHARGSCSRRVLNRSSTRSCCCGEPPATSKPAACSPTAGYRRQYRRIPRTAGSRERDRLGGIATRSRGAPPTRSRSPMTSVLSSQCECRDPNETRKSRLRHWCRRCSTPPPDGHDWRCSKPWKLARRCCPMRQAMHRASAQGAEAFPPSH